MAGEFTEWAVWGGVGDWVYFVFVGHKEGGFPSSQLR